MERMREAGIYGELARVQMIGEILAAWAKDADADERTPVVSPRFGPAPLEAMVDTIQEVYDNIVDELGAIGYEPKTEAPGHEPAAADGQGLDG